jgi:undecaprenyl-diphosphatase
MNRAKVSSKRWLLLGGVLLLAVSIFLDLAGDVWLQEGFNWDVPLMLALHGLSRPWLDAVFIAVTHSAGPLIAIPVIGSAVCFWLKNQKAVAILIVGSAVGSLLLNTALKFLFARPRQELFPPLVVERSYSFPSGHTMSAAAFFGLLSLLLWQRGHQLWAVIAFVWVFLVALSRVYLGAHYPSDVLASLALGTIWLVIVLLTTTFRLDGK